jgi:flagellar motor switch protein FliN
MSEENKENNQQETAPTLAPEEVLSSLEGFGDVKLGLKIVLGKVKMPIGQYLKITRGSIVELGKSRTALLDIMVNNKKIAEGEIVLAQDITVSDKVGIEVVNIFKPKKF